MRVGFLFHKRVELCMSFKVYAAPTPTGPFVHEAKAPLVLGEDGVGRGVAYDEDELLIQMCCTTATI